MNPMVTMTCEGNENNEAGAIPASISNVVQFPQPEQFDMKQTLREFGDKIVKIISDNWIIFVVVLLLVYLAKENK